MRWGGFPGLSRRVLRSRRQWLESEDWNLVLCRWWGRPRVEGFCELPVARKDGEMEFPLASGAGGTALATLGLSPVLLSTREVGA